MGWGAATWQAIAAIGSLVGSTASAIKAFSPPKISIPKVELPKEDLNKINQAIEANKELSDTARANIQQALTLYQQGRLTPQYQAMLDEWWNKQSTALQQRLSSMGLSNSTLAQSAFRELQTAYLTNMGNLLQKQLSDALSMTGLADSYRTSLMQKAQLELQGKITEANAYVQAQSFSAMMGQAQGQAFGNLSTAFGKLGELGKSPTQTPTVVDTFQTEKGDLGTPALKDNTIGFV